MEWLPPRITDPALLELAGAILQPAPRAEASTTLRQRIFGPGFRWAELIEFASGQDILPPLVWALQTRHLLMPVPKSLPPERRQQFVTTRLLDAFAEHLARQHDLKAQLHACLAALNHAGITPVILKGARYLLDAEPHWGTARPMRDIDLLIQPEDGAAAINALTGIGYVADAPSGLLSHHLPELRMAGRHGVVELHTQALAPAGASLMTTDFIWRNAVPVAVPGAGSAFILPPVWQALHAMLHHQASDDGYDQHILALKPLWEFACLAGSYSVADWASLAAHPGIGDLLGSWCVQAEQVFRLNYPADLPISAGARAQSRACLVEASEPDRRRRARFLTRQLRRGFSREVLALRYGVRPDAVGILLRTRHAWFLLRRYRFRLGARLFGGT